MPDLNPFDDLTEKWSERILATMAGIDATVNDVRRAVQTIERVAHNTSVILRAVVDGIERAKAELR